MWQHVVETTGLNVVSIAVDVQGPDVVRPWTEAAAATFPTFVDLHARLAADFGLAMVPTLVVVEDGVVALGPYRVDVLRDDNLEAVTAWASQQRDELDLVPMPVADASAQRDEALAWLTLADAALREGRTTDAQDSLERAFTLDPDNWLIRKQRWALAEPERFYAGDIDFDWQDRQRAAGR